MTVYITLTTAGTDSGPFSLYSNIDGFTTPFETGVSKSALVAGYTSTLVPDYTANIRVKSTGVCTNYTDLPVTGSTTTTTTSTSTSSTTTTTTTLVNSCYTIQGIWEVDDPAHPGGGYINWVDQYGVSQLISGLWNIDTFNIQASSIGSHAGVSITACV